ncbi:MAG: ATP-binding protein, partial [Bacteroidota bacterium]
KREYIALERTNVVEIANDVFNSLDLKAKARAITLKFNKAYDRPIWVLADKVKIGQVISNLVVNSINYGRENGGETEVRFYDMDENILIEIADNGIGISSKHLSRLFERFYRIDKSRARHAGGSGLGLAIVKHIVEAHKQTINVRSTENVGSTFSFTLKKAR